MKRKEFEQYISQALVIDLKTDTTNVTISENCTLSDAAIQGDLYITEGLGSDAVTLTNVTVNGSIIACLRQHQ